MKYQITSSQGSLKPSIKALLIILESECGN